MIDVPKTGSGAAPDLDNPDFDLLINNQLAVINRTQEFILKNPLDLDSVSHGLLSRQVETLERIQNLKFAANHTQQALDPGRFMGVGAIRKLG